MKKLNEAEIVKAFLKYHRKWSRFKKETQRQGNPSLDCNVINSIDYAFTWADSKEGHMFWSILNDKFQIMMEHFGVEGSTMTLADVLELD